MKFIPINVSLNNNYLVFFLILILLSSCSSLDSLKFWSSNESETETGEPKSLEDFNNKKTLKINWKLSFDGNNTLGNFEPAFSGENLFFAGSNGEISSINTKSGKYNWTIQSNQISTGVSAGFGIIVLSDNDGNVLAFDQNDGSVRWSTNVKGEVLANAAIDAQYVLIKTGSGELIALDKNTGELKWSYRSKLPNLTIRGSSSPVILNNQVYATFDNGRLGVFDLSSGFPLWDGAISYADGSSELENLIDSDSEPIIDGNLIYTTNYQGSLSIFDITQQRVVWREEISSFNSTLLIKNLIVISDAESNLKSFSQKSFVESWSSSDYYYRDLSNITSIGGNIIIGDYEGYIHILDPLNGKTIGRKKISKKPIKSIISRSNNFYAVDESFNLYSLSI